MKTRNHRFSAIAAVALLSLLAMPASAVNVLKLPLSGLRVTAAAPVNPGDGSTGGSGTGGSGGPVVVPPAPMNRVSADKTAIDFGTFTSPGATAQSSVTVSNTGATVVTVGTPTLSGSGRAAYSIESNGCTVAINPNGTCVVAVRFSPSSTGAFDGTLTIPSSADNASLVVDLDGALRPVMALTSVSPAVFELAGGSPLVVLTGTNFEADASVKFGTTQATCSFQSSTELRCTPPAQATPGLFDVTVTDASDSRTVTRTEIVRYVSLSASTVAPSSLSTLGGQAFTVSGTGFMPGASVMVGAQSATSCAVSSHTSLSCVSPASTNGVVSLTVTNPGGTAVTMANAVTYFTPVTYAALDFGRIGTGLAMSEDFLSINNTATNTAWRSVLGTVPKSTGKYYFEVLNMASTSAIGIAGTSVTTAQLEAAIWRSGVNGIQYLPYAGGVYLNGGRVRVATATVAGAIIGVAVDRDANTIQFYAKPAGGSCSSLAVAHSISSVTGAIVPALSLNSASGTTTTMTANFGQSPFACSVPAGFTAGWY